MLKVSIADKPTSSNIAVANFVDDKAIIFIHKDLCTASLNLQNHLDILTIWYKKWYFKVY